MELPARIGRYELEESLGGGAVRAYRARDTVTGRAVIVKILADATCEDTAARERFLAEAGTPGNPAEGICDSGEDSRGRPYLVMESQPQSGLSIVARKPPRAKPSRPRWIVPAALAALLLLAAAAYLLLRPKRPAPRPAAKLAPALTTPSGEMVLVPAGTFLSGESKEPLWLPAFYIDKTEVTNSAYAAFCRAAPHDLPPGFPRGLADYPVVNVSMADARAFAAWAGKRIPSGREWEKAARGDNGQTFPWGEEPDRSRANIGLITLLPANAFPKGASPYGALQMIGNAWELVADAHSPDEQTMALFSARMDPPLAADEPWCAIRGGAYDNPQLTARLLWDSTSVPERWRSPNIGFRCVQDAK